MHQGHVVCAHFSGMPHLASAARFPASSLCSCSLVMLSSCTMQRQKVAAVSKNISAQAASAPATEWKAGRRHSGAGWAESLGCQDSLNAPSGCWPHSRQSRSLLCALAVLGCSLQIGMARTIACGCSSTGRQPMKAAAAKWHRVRQRRRRQQQQQQCSSMLASCLAPKGPVEPVAAAHPSQRSKQTCMGRKQTVALVATWPDHGSGARHCSMHLHATPCTLPKLPTRGPNPLTWSQRWGSRWGACGCV